MFCHWLRLFTLIGLLWSSISVRTYQGYKAMPKDVAHRIPHTKELSAGSLLVAIAVCGAFFAARHQLTMCQAILDAVWILLALVLLNGGSKKGQFARGLNKKVAVIWLLDLAFCAMLAGGVYLQSKFIPWHLSVCKQPQTWLQSPDGYNFFVEISYWLPDDRRHRIADRSAEGLCRNMVLAQGAAIAAM